MRVRLPSLVYMDVKQRLKDEHIHQKGRQDASAWVSEMKEETLL